ncbi:interferon lambda-1-like [Rhinolophus ferrumequinum]|uniref:interferon lambda-1-like n=1 Tax=Rhinolophus ferrumequinum TaxID=59479 RepID=UPI00140F904B|nr:interferon lambda-1-like [Rhinolophus ferrumequinum]
MAALGSMVLGLARAGPIPTSKPTMTRRGCHFSRFQSLSPRELEAFKAKVTLEEWLPLKSWSCSSCLFPRTRDLRQLQVLGAPWGLGGLSLQQAPPQSHLRHWLCHLQRPQRSLKASVTFNLSPLVTWDLKCVACGDLHVGATDRRSELAAELMVYSW